MGGVTRLTISLAVIMMEVTTHHNHATLPRVVESCNDNAAIGGFVLLYALAQYCKAC